MSSTVPEILFYGRERFCGDCARSRARLTELGIPWTEFNIEGDEAALAETLRLTGRRNVPTIVIGEAVLVEPSNDQLDRALVAAGYTLEEED